MSSRRLTSTSYAILGLLATQPWSTYELANQLRRALHYFWPRAESNLYAEPKRLVAAGLADAREEWTGDRKRTVYSITEAGRARLEEWLGTDVPPVRVESEAYLRILFGNMGSKDDVLRALRRIEDDAVAMSRHYAQLGEEYARGEGPFPDRIHVNALLVSLAISQGRTTAAWARSARADVERWDDTAAPDVDWAVKKLRAAVGEGETSSDAP
jgi:DNA-binding PadR family transcriptional regulator